MRLLTSRTLLAAVVTCVCVACTGEPQWDDDDDDDGGGGAGAGAGQQLPPSCDGPLPAPAQNPRPADLALDVKLLEDGSKAVEWEEDAATYNAHEDWVFDHQSECGNPLPLVPSLIRFDIHFGLTPEPPLHQSQVLPTIDQEDYLVNNGVWLRQYPDVYNYTYRITEPLAFETTYYWRVVATMPRGTTVGPVFSFTTGVESDPSCPDAPTVTDQSGFTYPTVQIGNECWMRDNLRAGVYGSPEQNQTLEKRCTKYSSGPDCHGLYLWHELTGYGGTAPTGCPTGWHLPSLGELQTAMNNAGLLEPQFHGFFANNDSPEGACGYYWTSTSSSSFPTSAMVVKRCYLGEQETLSMNKESYHLSARCVRN